ncbi:Uncharacterised protein [Fusicatenibacter saccharivorans]|uniref:DUF7601 domain-containing protein n=1 Tax=Fusicatenibacter saccharivorans TaxID=1150298 RepID=A0A174CNN8_9FIRM|nr:DUF5979 domain-containing protein [Fusicatenibacter saccharivorans]CUO13365.1 Uncharacterised protein [Fusicatenibacter saccharivorans]
MSMKKFTKKMLAIVAAGAMTMGLAMPVFAEGAGTTTKEAYITKVFNTEVAKDVNFTFKAEQQKNGAGVDNLVDTDAAVRIDDAKFTTSDGTGTKTKRWTVTFPTYQEAGKYSYKVTETGNSLNLDDKGEKEKMLMSKAEYLMDVYVSNTTAGGYEISNIIVNKIKNDQGTDEKSPVKVDIGSGEDNGFKFENTYVQEAGNGTDPSNPGTDPDADYDNLGSLNVSKKVEKNVTTGDTTQPATNDTFSFTAEFTFPAGTDENTLGGVNANGKKITLTNGTTHTFTLTAGTNMKFTKLPVGTKITVTEAAKANYKGSAAVVINNENKAPVVATKFNEEIKVWDKDANTGYKLGQTKNAVDVTNKFNNVPTTGIIMNTLPYVLMVALCAVALFGFVAFKRKKVQK